MAYFLLIVHIATAIVFIGALTISVSLFPRYAAADPDVDDKSHDAHPVALAMHRITKVYGRLAIIPPAVGITLAVVLGRLDELWIILSVALSLIGGALLIWGHHPLAATDAGGSTTRTEHPPPRRRSSRNPQLDLVRHPRPHDPETRGRRMTERGLQTSMCLLRSAPHCRRDRTVRAEDVPGEALPDEPVSRSIRIEVIRERVRLCVAGTQLVSEACWKTGSKRARTESAR